VTATGTGPLASKHSLDQINSFFAWQAVKLILNPSVEQFLQPRHALLKGDLRHATSS